MKRRGQRRHARAKRARALVRLLSVFVLALFVGQSTYAFAFAAPVTERDSCCDASPEDAGDDGGEDQDCPCPLDCSKGCAGSFMRAVPPTPPSLDLPLLPAVERSSLASARIPPAATPLEILHVPKR